MHRQPVLGAVITLILLRVNCNEKEETENIYNNNAPKTLNFELDIYLEIRIKWHL